VHTKQLQVLLILLGKRARVLVQSLCASIHSTRAGSVRVDPARSAVTTSHAVLHLPRMSQHS
jgi:hypothetical protein